MAHGNTTHGLSGSEVYNRWNNMIQRCTNDSQPSYEDYGARGIMVCDRWFDFENFLEDMGFPPESCSLDRIDNDGHYTPDNCRWADYKTQMLNRNNTHWIEHGGFKMCLSDWAKALGMSKWALRRRINILKWSVEEALTTPLREKR